VRLSDLDEKNRVSSGPGCEKKSFFK
jgi:hypothetical protein